MYIYKRGKGSKRRVLHIAKYNQFGDVSGTLCDNRMPLDTTINVPLGMPICKLCKKTAAALRGEGDK